MPADRSSGENPWLERRVLHYAHQGGAREAPSSTLHAIQQALDCGAHAIELDVHATSDGEIVVCHDTTVDRTTNASGRIAELTLDELRRLDNAYWWVPGHQVLVGEADDAYPLRGRAPEDRTLGIATLREVLEALEGVFVNLDIKETVPTVDGYEAELARVLAEFGRTDDVIIASFHDVATARFREVAPHVHTSLGMVSSVAFYAYVAGNGPIPEIYAGQVALQMPARWGEIVVLDEVFVERAHEAGLAVHAWTIDEPDEMRRLIDVGVDGIISDRPSVLQGVLAARAAGFTPLR